MNATSWRILLGVIVSILLSGMLWAGGPLRIIPQQGQWASTVSAKIPLVGGSAYLEQDQWRFTFLHPDDWEALQAHHHHDEGNQNVPSEARFHAFSMQFQQTEPTTTISYGDAYPFYYNYFLGNDPAAWATAVPVYASATYHDMWPGVDILLGESEGHLKYDYVIRPGGIPEDIAWTYDGVSPTIKEGKLTYSLSHGVSIIESIPAAFQMIDGRQVKVDVRYGQRGSTFYFEVGDYNQNYDLIIDPVLVFSSYTGSSADNFGFTATYDKDELLYGGGIVFNNGYPTTNGAYQTSWGGIIDLGITKFNADGSQLIYSTFIGGESAETPNSLVTNEDNELFIFGLTSSFTFPVSANAYQRTFAGGVPVNYASNGTNFTNGVDLFVFRLDSTGTQLQASTLLGGAANDGVNDGLNPTAPTKLTYNYGDFFRGEIVLDDQSNVYVATCTQSSDFPISSGALQPNFGGLQDAVMFSLNADLSNLRWSTFLGGTDVDAAYSVKLDGGGNPYVSGGTVSTDFPVSAQAANPFYIGGGGDGFLSHIEQGGFNLLASTFVGTPSFDQNYFIEIDAFDQVYVVGQTEGQFFVSPGTYSNPGSGQYIARFTPDLTQLDRSTVFGKGDGDPDLSPTAMLIDQCNNVYVSGWGGATNFFAQNPDTDITGLPTTPDAYQSQTDGSDFYFIVFAEDMDSLLYATYFGGNVSEEHVDGGTSRFDSRGAIYQAVCAGCRGNSDFPTTPGAWSATNNSTNCNLGVIKFDLELASVEALAAITGNPSGCAPLTVSFENQGSKDAQYFWDFGDGTTSTEENPSHTYLVSDTFLITFIVSDTNSVCKFPDTTFVPVVIFDEVIANFRYNPTIVNFGEPVQFTDLSDPATSYRWDFGDGNTSADQNPTHIFEEPGVYEVCLFIESNGTCFDTVCQQIIIPIIDVPTAFSPNNDGNNDILFVKGIGVQEFVFKLYNRWGELVFETTRLGRGWDGRVNGIPQEQEVYVYTLEAILENTQTVTKKGNVTLIR